MPLSVLLSSPPWHVMLRHQVFHEYCLPWTPYEQFIKDFPLFVKAAGRYWEGKEIVLTWSNRGLSVGGELRCPWFLTFFWEWMIHTRYLLHIYTCMYMCTYAFSPGKKNFPQNVDGSLVWLTPVSFCFLSTVGHFLTDGRHQQWVLVEWNDRLRVDWLYNCWRSWIETNFDK